MTIVSHTTATLPVQRFVLALNTLLAETPQVPAARAGTKRRIKREKAQAKAMKKWWASAAKATKTTKTKTPSRQVLRRMKRDQERNRLSVAKSQALKAGRIGGAAAITA